MPMAQTQAVATPEGRSEPAVRARVILVIEDEARIRRAIRDALHDVADRVVEASAGGEGVALAATERPELVVLDLGLPDLAGLEVCLELRLGQHADHRAVGAACRAGEGAVVERRGGRLRPETLQPPAAPAARAGDAAPW